MANLGEQLSGQIPFSLKEAQGVLPNTDEVLAPFFQECIESSRKSGALMYSSEFPDIANNEYRTVLIYAESQNVEVGNSNSYVILWPKDGDKLSSYSFLVEEKDGLIVSGVHVSRAPQFPTDDLLDEDTYVDRLIPALDRVVKSKKKEGVSVASLLRGVGDVGSSRNRQNF